MNEQAYLSDLACGFIQNTLPPEEKRQVHELIMHSPKFLELLKFELAVMIKTTSLKQTIPDSLKIKVYSKITSPTYDVFYKKMFHTVLETTLPAITWPVLQIMKRSVLANE